MSTNYINESNLMSMSSNSTQRFSDRVKDYILYRPDYPETIINFLEKNCSLSSKFVIADIGSGTGKSTEMFLKNGNTVFGIEPNDEMRHAAESILENYQEFKSIKATAEITGLEGHSIDLVIAGQAFHWFHQSKTKKEFQRILKPGGYVILIWNERPVNQSGFMGEYDEFLIQNSIDYAEIDHRNIDEKALSAFYAPETFALQAFENQQIFDFDGLKGRYDSCSYAIPKMTPAI
jgi:SAM-dependent methyltransferase